VGIRLADGELFLGPMLTAAAFQTARRRGVASPIPRRGTARSSLSVRCEGALLYPLNADMCAKRVLPLKVQKDGCDGKDLLFGEFRIDRERETVLAQLFSDRKIARSVTKMRVGLL